MTERIQRLPSEASIRAGGFEFVVRPFSGNVDNTYVEGHQKAVIVDVKNRKVIKVSANDLNILQVLANQTFSEETSGVGQAEHSLLIEKRAEGASDSGRIDDDDFYGAVQRSKTASRKLTPEDLTDLVFASIPVLREYSTKSPAYIQARSIFVQKLNEYWKKRPKNKKFN